MSISSATAVTITLLLVALFLLIAGNVNTMSYRLEQSVQIYAQLELGIEGEDAKAIEEKVEAIPHVAKVRYATSDEEFESFIEGDMGGKDYEMFKDDNPLPGALYVDAQAGEYVAAISKEINKIEGMGEVGFGGPNATEMLASLALIRTGGGIIALILCMLAIFLISNTIKITIQARKVEIGIMRNVGASNWFIKMPFLMEGMIIGLMGSIIPVCFAVFGYGYLYDMADGKLMNSSLLMIEPPLPFVVHIGLALVGLSVVVGIVGSLLSVNKYLKWKR